MGREFKVMLDPRGFYINIGAGKGYTAADVNEVTVALKHWSGRTSDEVHRGANPECPLCRAMKAEEERLKLAELVREDRKRRREKG